MEMSGEMPTRQAHARLAKLTSNKLTDDHKAREERERGCVSYITA